MKPASPHVCISCRRIRPESPALPLAARGGQAVRRNSGPPLRSEGTEAALFGRELGVCPRTVPPPGNAVASGLHLGLATLQPRRRDRLPEAAVSEGAPQQSPFRHATTAPSRQSDGRFSHHGTPSRADEGGGARRRGGLTAESADAASLPAGKKT